MSEPCERRAVREQPAVRVRRARHRAWIATGVPGLHLAATDDDRASGPRPRDVRRQGFAHRGQQAWTVPGRASLRPAGGHHRASGSTPDSRPPLAGARPSLRRRSAAAATTSRSRQLCRSCGGSRAATHRPRIRRHGPGAHCWSAHAACGATSPRTMPNLLVSLALWFPFAAALVPVSSQWGAPGRSRPERKGTGRAGPLRSRLPAPRCNTARFLRLPRLVTRATTMLSTDGRERS
jgi:hypothetical protein